MVARRRHRAMQAVGTARPRRGRLVLIAILLAAGCGALAARGSGQDHAILITVQQVMLVYSGVFALVALTAAVASGLVAMLLDILAHRSHVIGAVVPFLAGGRTLHPGLGTLASDLVLLILITGIARRRFAAHWPATWRAMHVTAYLGWPLAITRSRAEVAPQPVPGRAAFGTVAYAPAAVAVAGQQDGWLPPAPPHRALPRGVQCGGVQRGGIRHYGGWHDGSRYHDVRHNAVRRQVEPR